MRERLHIELCTTPEQAKKAFAFLESQEHVPVDWALPIRIVRRGGVIIGVTQELGGVPVLMSCWNKDKAVCSTRDIAEGTDAIRLLLEGTTKSGAVYAACPPTSPMFAAMEKLGFAKTGLCMFLSTPIDSVKEAT